MKLLLINNQSYYIDQLKEILGPHEVHVVDFNQMSLTAMQEYDAVVLSGSYRFLPNKEEFSKEITLIKETSIPVLGICFGFQLICYAYGSRLEMLDTEKKGVWQIKITNPDKIFKGITSLTVFENHGWSIKEVKTLIPLAESKTGIEIIKHPEKKIYGFQFHPEMVSEKTNAALLVKNFLSLCEDE